MLCFTLQHASRAPPAAAGHVLLPAQWAGRYSGSSKSCMTLPHAVNMCCRQPLNLTWHIYVQGRPPGMSISQGPLWHPYARGQLV